jgi:hypothetical protein
MFGVESFQLVCFRKDAIFFKNFLSPLAKDLIRTAVGQTRLLIKERFKQFEGLVNDCEYKRGEKETTCTDLDGFWDMVNFQVCDEVFRMYYLLKNKKTYPEHV